MSVSKALITVAPLVGLPPNYSYAAEVTHKMLKLAA